MIYLNSSLKTILKAVLSAQSLPKFQEKIVNYPPKKLGFLWYTNIQKYKQLMKQVTSNIEVNAPKTPRPKSQQQTHRSTTNEVNSSL